MKRTETDLIDIHTHLLPGVDDGAATLADSLDAIRMEVSAGTKVIFLTPHVDSATDLERSPEFLPKFEELKTATRDAGIDVRLELGAEVFPTWNLLKALDSDKPITLGLKRKYILLGPPRIQLPNDISDLVFEIHTRGITPILAHPERVNPVQKNIRVLHELLDLGMLLQINAGSINGRYGKHAKQTVLELLRLKMVHFVASDCHRMHIEPVLASGRTAIHALFDEKTARALSIDNPNCILESTQVPISDRRFVENRKSWFGRVFGR